MRKIAKLDEWVTGPVDRARAVADKVGLTSLIEQGAADEKTAMQIYNELRSRIDAVRGDESGSVWVRHVRNSLGIPSMDNADFKIWKQSRTKPQAPKTNDWLEDHPAPQPKAPVKPTKEWWDA